MIQLEMVGSIPTWTPVTEVIGDRVSRGNSDSQGSQGYCHNKQHWWNWAFVDVSSELHSSEFRELIHLTNPVIPEASSDVYREKKNVIETHLYKAKYMKTQKFTLNVELKAKGDFDVNRTLVFNDQSTAQRSIFWQTGVIAEKIERTGGSSIACCLFVSIWGWLEELSMLIRSVVAGLWSSWVTASSLGLLAGDRLV